jgi:hypothetical protein
MDRVRVQQRLVGDRACSVARRTGLDMRRRLEPIFIVSYEVQ